MASAVTSSGATVYEDTEHNLFHMTYQVSPEIKLKQVMPKDYDEQLLYLQGKRVIDAVWFIDYLILSNCYNNKFVK